MSIRSRETLLDLPIQLPCSLTHFFSLSPYAQPKSVWRLYALAVLIALAVGDSFLLSPYLRTFVRVTYS